MMSTSGWGGIQNESKVLQGSANSNFYEGMQLKILLWKRWTKYEEHHLQATGSVCCVKINSRECDNSAAMPIKRKELSIQAISMKEGFKEAPPVQQLHSSRGQFTGSSDSKLWIRWDSIWWEKSCLNVDQTFRYVRYMSDPPRSSYLSWFASLANTAKASNLLKSSRFGPFCICPTRLRHGDPMSSVVIHGFAYQEAIDVWFRDQLLAVLGGDAATVLDSDLPVRHANG